MSREIKFRAWLKDEKKMVELDDIRNLSCDNYQLVYFDNDWKFIDVDDNELMQYTGRKDKNGVKIFEGDIVKLDDEICTIVWDEPYLEYAVNFKEDGNTGLCEFAPKDLEVIGNIYENKELLSHS